MKDVIIGVCIILFIVFTVLASLDHKRRIDKLATDLTNTASRVDCLQSGGYVNIGSVKRQGSNEWYHYICWNKENPPKQIFDWWSE